MTYQWQKDKKAIRQSEAKRSGKMGPGPGRPPEAQIWAASLLVSSICIVRGSECSEIKLVHLSFRLISGVGMRAPNPAMIGAPCSDSFSGPLRGLSSNAVRAGHR